jgi:serine/threonine-protein kinase
MGAAWGPDDTIVFTPTNREGLYLVSATGGTPQVLTTLEAHEKSHRWPQFIPGSRAVLFTITTPDMTSFDGARIGVVSLDTHQRRVVLDGGTNPRFVSTGHLVYLRGASLVAIPFDPRRLEITGQPAAALDGVSVFDAGDAQFAVAQTGLVAYVRGEVHTGHDRLVWVDRHGKVESLMDARRDFGSVRLSPDGQRLALMIGGTNEQVWLYDIARRTLSRLTFEWDNQYPTWMPDGKRVVFRSDRTGVFNLYSQQWDGSGPAERLTESPDSQFASSWTRDGNVAAFVDNGPKTGFDIWLLMVAPERRVRPLIQTPFNEFFPTFSPDGHWLAYVSDETGRQEVYIRPFPSLGAKWQISTDGGMAPVWEPQHGQELYYQNGGKLMAVAIQTHPTLVAAAPRLLFDGPYKALYDVGRDGRFIMIEHKPSEEPSPQITLVQNWFEELKRRVPTK